MDRWFDLEEKIVAASNVVDDLKTLARYLLETDITDKDYIFNALHGLACLQEARNKDLWDAFVVSFNLDDYASEDIEEDDDGNYPSNK